MKLVIYRTRGLRGTGYRWRLVADNGRKLASGGQGYSRRIDMERAVVKALGGELLAAIPGGPGPYLARPVGAVNPLGEAHLRTLMIPVEDRTR